jgi:Icc-related predicted phosphoesterase
MKITRLNPYPTETVPYLNAMPRSRQTVAGMKGVERTFLPITIGYVEGMPAHLQGLIVASDLQGKVKNPQTRELRLLGEVLPEILKLIIEIELGLDPLKFGAVLAGDMFAMLEKRGGLGDVIPVWEAFRGEFKWVAGVAGNHDSFGETSEDLDKFRNRAHMHLLEGRTTDLDGLRLGGVSGIIGPTRKLNRLSPDDFTDQLLKVQSQSPAMMVLHEGPDHPSTSSPGNSLVRECLELAAPSLVVCGHRHWDAPLQTLPNGVQVLNSDARAFILLPEGA